MDNIQQEILRLVEEAGPKNPITYVQNIVKPLAVNSLNQAIETCTECPIANCVKTKISGNPNASVLILGESPTVADNSGIAFQCDEQSNKMIKALQRVNANFEELAFMNSIACFPRTETGEKRTPTVKERKACKPFVDYLVETIKPVLIIASGGIAINNLNEDIGKQKVTNIRGKVFYYRGIPVMPTYHPVMFSKLEATGMYGEDHISSLMWEFIEDVENALLLTKELYPHLNIILEEEE